MPKVNIIPVCVNGEETKVEKTETELEIERVMRECNVKCSFEELSDKKKEIIMKLIEKEKELEEVKGTRCQIWSRVTGFFRPIDDYNPGKLAEFHDRKTYDVYLESCYKKEK